MHHSDACLDNISLPSEDETCLYLGDALNEHILISCVSSCHENKFRGKSGSLPIPRAAYLNRCRCLELDQRKQIYEYSTWQMYNRITNFRKSQPDCYNKKSFKGDTLEKVVRKDRIDSTSLCPERSRIISTYQMHLSVENDSGEDDIFYFEM